MFHAVEQLMGNNLTENTEVNHKGCGLTSILTHTRVTCCLVTLDLLVLLSIVRSILCVESFEVALISERPHVIIH